MNIKLRDLEDVPVQQLLELLNDKKVRRHLVRHDMYNAATCKAFVQSKREHWVQHGYGVFAIYKDGDFAGWGGPQAWTSGDVEMGLVLLPRYWGLGPKLFSYLVEKTFNDLAVSSVIVLLRSSRSRSKALERSGFKFDGKDMFEGENFIRYRMEHPKTKESYIY